MKFLARLPGGISEIAAGLKIADEPASVELIEILHLLVDNTEHASIPCGQGSLPRKGHGCVP